MNWESTRTDTRVLLMKWILLSLNWPVIKQCRIMPSILSTTTTTTKPSLTAMVIHPSFFFAGDGDQKYYLL